MRPLLGGAVVVAVVISAAFSSCGEDEDTSRIDEISTGVWIDQVARSAVPDFCTDAALQDQLPAFLNDEYEVADEDLEAVTEVLLARCEAAG